MSRIERLNKTLADLQASSADIEACACVSEDGLIMASSLPQGVEETRVAAMSAAILSIGTRAALELKRGKLEQIFVRGELGYIILMNAGAHAVLMALARKEAKLGLLFLDVSETAKRAAEVLS